MSPSSITQALRCAMSLCACLLALHYNPAAAAEIHGAGSTAATRLYESWGEGFKITGNTLKYDSIGSSGGIKAVLAGTADFGASDVALPEEQLKKEGLICIPTAITGIVPALNLPGVGDGKLRLTGEVLAAIFSGKLRSWNDEALRRLNPSLKLPAQPIRVIAREDGSGSTHVFSGYLSAVSEQWRTSMGNDFRLKWPESTLLAKGSSGVAKLLQSTPYSIGYLESGSIHKAKLNYALLANQAGSFIEPSETSFRAALNSSRWTFEGRFEESLVNAKDKLAWPITTGTFVILKKNTTDPQRMARVLNFFSGAFMQADHLVPASGYVALPLKTQARAVHTLGSVQERGDIPVFFDVRWTRPTTP